MSKSLALNEMWVRKTFRDAHDITFQQIRYPEFQDAAVLIVYCEGLSDSKKLNEAVLPGLRACLERLQSAPLNENTLMSAWPFSSLHKESSLNELIPKLFNGELILFFEGIPVAFTVDISDHPRRVPNDSSTEVSIRGPRDGFVEELSVNVALVRKRLRTDTMAFEQYVIGRRSRTRIGLLYMKDIIRPEIVAEVKRRLSAIDVDGIYSSSELEQFLAESKWTIFPLFDYTSRPDYVVTSLLRGRFAIVMDGVPTAIIAPANLTLLFKSAEDIHHSFTTVTFGRLLRIFGLLVALLLPGLYVGIATYHQDQLPLTMLATLVMSRQGVPFPTPLEALVMLIMFELFREAGARLPNVIGQTLSVVGGLIIGEAAIRAGLASPALVVVIATTAVATFILVNQSLVSTVSILRIGILFAASLFGMFGFLLTIFVLLIHLANLRSFGISYVAPFTPFTCNDFVQAERRTSVNPKRKRPEILGIKDTRKKGGT